MEKVSQRKVIKKPNNIESDYHKINSLIFAGNEMFLKVDRKVYKFKIKDISLKLYNASKKEREAFRVICSGYGISWPLIDEDLSIDGLIKTYNKLLN